MKRLTNKSLVVSLLIIAIFLLVTSVAWAGWKRGANYEWFFDPAIGENVICEDGLKFGLATIDGHPGPFTVALFKEGGPTGDEFSDPLDLQDPNLITAKQISLETKTNWPAICTGFQGDFEGNSDDLVYCGGLFTIEKDLTAYNNVEVRLYEWDGSQFLPDENRPLVGTHQVSNSCSINQKETFINILQRGAGSTNKDVKEALVFEVEAYVGAGKNNGEGVKNVVLQIFDPGGKKVIDSGQVTAPPYCAFGKSAGGGNPCQAYNYLSHNFEWPGGILMANGAYTLRAKVKTSAGNTITKDFSVNVQLPVLYSIVQTGPGTTDPLVSKSLVFQVEAYVGPRYSDGKYIDYVDFRILGPGGQEVYQKQENGAKYCAFSGGGSANPDCKLHVFADNNFKWPEPFGGPIVEGPHTLRATIKTSDGRSKQLDTPIEIRFSGSGADKKFIYLPFIVRQL